MSATQTRLHKRQFSQEHCIKHKLLITFQVLLCIKQYSEQTNKIWQIMFVDKIGTEKRGFQIRLHISVLEFCFCTYILKQIMLSTMCSRRLKQAAFGRTYGPKRRIVPLDGCACMIITTRMLNALRHLPHLCLYEQRRQFAACTLRKNTEAEI